MGNPQPNTGGGAHVSQMPSGPVLTGYRLHRHHGSSYVDSPDMDAATWAAIKAAAAQGFAAFDAACTAALGTWWTAWSLVDRAAWHVAVKAA